MKVELIDRMGSDLSVVNAARVSFDKVSDWVETCKCGIQRNLKAKYNQWPGCGEDERDCMSQPATYSLNADDAKLINYLAKHNHWTPFAHTSISLRMQAPLPIRTQCFKHKQGLVENEESRRYINSRPVLFVPDHFRSKPDGSVKQGSAGVHPSSGLWLEHYTTRCEAMIDIYEEMIEDGVCPEQARFVLPQGVEVNWIWTGNLYAFANFYLKRTDPHAQLEGRQLATEVGKIVQPLFPVSWKALVGV